MLVVALLCTCGCATTWVWGCESWKWPWKCVVVAAAAPWGWERRCGGGWFMGMEGAPGLPKNDGVAAFFVGLLILLFMVVKSKSLLELCWI